MILSAYFNLIIHYKTTYFFPKISKSIISMVQFLETDYN